MMHTLRQRLLPLFLFNLAIGFMFHYSIVFPYMDSLGFTTSQLITYAIVTNIVVLLVEIPAGIVADRWSRKGILLISVVFMATSCIIFSGAESFVGLMVATAVAGLYFGLSSGAQEAMVYDVLLEHNDRKNYEKVIGRLRSVFTAGLVISSIAGAIIASQFSFQLPFYLSVIACVVGFVTLLFFREPRLHREVESVKLTRHLTELFKLLTQHPETRALVLTNILVGIMFCFMIEVDPLWPIALGLATIWFGPLNALLLSSQGLAGLIAGIAKNKIWFIRLLSAGVLLAAFGLTIQNIYLVVLSEFILILCAESLMILLSGRIQDKLPSSQRSGSESAISTVSSLSFIAVLPVFAFIAHAHSVFVATWVLVAIAICALLALNRSLGHRQHPDC